MEGYIIIPIEQLPGDIFRMLEINPQAIITQREMVAMYSSSVIEINKGDNSCKSLNVKLYNCLAPYAQGELDAITKRNLK